jgi:hypothetical protein
MKTPAAWSELSFVAAGLMVWMVAVMWAQHPAGSCALSPESNRPLVLSRQTDREHLATDVAAADRVARRYMRAAEDTSQEQNRFLECEAILVQQIATRHGLSPDQVRASASSRDVQ